MKLGDLSIRVNSLEYPDYGLKANLEIKGPGLHGKSSLVRDQRLQLDLCGKQVSVSFTGYGGYYFFVVSIF